MGYGLILGIVSHGQNLITDCGIIGYRFQLKKYT